MSAPDRPTVDFIVTTQGGRSTARAVRAGGGLVGMRSSENPPEGIPIDFLDWPFQLDDPSVQHHIDMAEQLRPKYAVAPDIEKGRTLDEVVDVAEVLRKWAEHVIVVPKEVSVDEVPNHYVLGMPFRDEWETDTGVNQFADFRNRPTHILGGNPTEQLTAADRFDMSVTSVDTPNPLAWADAGRVWVARLGGADGVKSVLIDVMKERSNDPDRVDRKIEGLADAAEKSPSQYLSELPVDDFLEEFDVEFLLEESAEAGAALDVPTYRQMLDSRFYRIKFTVQNLREAWQDRRVTKTRPVEPGRGPPPPAPEGLHGEGREEVLDRFMDAVITDEMGRVERTERGLATFGDDDGGGE